jgi:hypothetical protein
MVWVEAEGLPEKAVKHYADRESELLRGVWEALIAAAQQIYKPSSPAHNAPTPRVTDMPRDSGTRKHPETFPNRAKWLECELNVRGWNKHRVQEYNGPNHKTVQKIRDGKWVQDGVLKALIAALEQTRPLYQEMPMD